MNLTGKNKIKFDEWLNETKPVTFEIKGSTFNFSTIGSFVYLTPSMQWGVLQDYADSVGYDLDIRNYLKQYAGFVALVSQLKEGEVARWSETNFDTRQEARTAAVIKFDELRNEEL